MRRTETHYDRELATLELAEEAVYEADEFAMNDDTLSTRDMFIKAYVAYEKAYSRVRRREMRMETTASAEAAVEAADRACGLAYDARRALRGKQESPEYAKAQEAFAKARYALKRAEIDMFDVHTAETRRAFAAETRRYLKLAAYNLMRDVQSCQNKINVVFAVNMVDMTHSTEV